MGLRNENAERFCREAIEVAESMGAVLSEEPGPWQEWDTPPYTIETKAGSMMVRPYARPKLGKREAVFTVFCEFADVERANALELVSHCNPHGSGNYNFDLLGHDTDVDRALDWFRQHLERCIS